MKNLFTSLKFEIAKESNINTLNSYEYELAPLLQVNMINESQFHTLVELASKKLKSMEVIVK